MSLQEEGGGVLCGVGPVSVAQRGSQDDSELEDVGLSFQLRWEVVCIEGGRYTYVGTCRFLDWALSVLPMVYPSLTFGSGTRQRLTGGWLSAIEDNCQYLGGKRG